MTLQTATETCAERFTLRAGQSESHDQREVVKSGWVERPQGNERFTLIDHGGGKWVDRRCTAAVWSSARKETPGLENGIRFPSDVHSEIDFGRGYLIVEGFTPENWSAGIRFPSDVHSEIDCGKKQVPTHRVSGVLSAQQTPSASSSYYNLFLPSTAVFLGCLSPNKRPLPTLYNAGYIGCKPLNIHNFSQNRRVSWVLVAQ
ncbi:hypothetical protein B0H13DRAFT_1921282 [Mycena leptocephala]|nr:hypothetical protein B0H13DRAFT_1921282 [Mycena leptocephala]